MDKTGLTQKQNYYKVVVSKVSSNVWSKSSGENYHMIFVVCVSVTDTVALSLLIVPGKCLNRYLMEVFYVEVSHVTTSSKFFIDSTLFFYWIFSLLTLHLIKLNAHFSWFIMAVEDIIMMTL